MNSNTTYQVSPETVRMIELGHPWIIADHFTKKWTGVKAGQVVSLVDNGNIFLATAMLDPNDRIIARVLDQKSIHLDKAWLTKRIKIAIALRSNHCGIKNDTSAYRLVNAEGDFLPGVTIDRYGNYLMIQLYSECWRIHLKLLTEVLQKLIKPVGIYEKTRPQKTRELEAVSDNKNYGRLLVGTPAPTFLKVLENGLYYHVSLEKGLNTGLFLDQRMNRLDLMTRTAGKRVLNLFSYTGAFSVAAAAAGAKLVTSVDTSQRYTQWAKDNFRINQLDSQKHEFIVGDCMATLSAMTKTNKQFDIILMDPPSFSTTAKSRFTTRGGTADLVAAALALLVNGGMLITSSNHQKIDLADYLKELRRGSLAAGYQLQTLFFSGQSPDFPYPVTFPEGRYLKYVISIKQKL